jgi:hypothetical protein
VPGETFLTLLHGASPTHILLPTSYTPIKKVKNVSPGTNTDTDAMCASMALGLDMAPEHRVSLKSNKRNFLSLFWNYLIVLLSWPLDPTHFQSEYSRRTKKAGREARLK